MAHADSFGDDESEDDEGRDDRDDDESASDDSLSGTSTLKAWAATPGGRNAPRAQRRG